MLHSWLRHTGLPPNAGQAGFLGGVLEVTPCAILSWFDGCQVNDSPYSSGSSSEFAESQSFIPQAQPAEIGFSADMGVINTTRTPYDFTGIQDINQIPVAQRISSDELRKHYRLRCKNHPSRTKPEQLERHMREIYQCTRSCGFRTDNVAHWKRHEERQCLQALWSCPMCFENPKRKSHARHVFHREDQFIGHLKKTHKKSPGESLAMAKSNRFSTGFAIPSWCGFCCGCHRSESLEDRLDHLAEHFKDGKCMRDWIPVPVIEGISIEDGEDEGHGDGDSDIGGSPTGPGSGGAHNDGSSSGSGNSGDPSSEPDERDDFWVGSNSGSGPSVWQGWTRASTPVSDLVRAMFALCSNIRQVLYKMGIVRSLLFWIAQAWKPTKPDTW